MELLNYWENYRNNSLYNKTLAPKEILLNLIRCIVFKCSKNCSNESHQRAELMKYFVQILGLYTEMCWLVGIKVKFCTLSVFWFQLFWGLCAWGQQFSAGGGLVPYRNNLRRCVRPSYLQGTGCCDSAMWLVYSLNCYWLPSPTAISCFYIFTFSKH